MKFLLLAIIAIIMAMTVAGMRPPPLTAYAKSNDFQELYFEQRLNPFNPYDTTTFPQRYFFDKSNYKAGAPLCVYTGAEAPLEYYWAHSGGSYKLGCNKLNAALLWIEHRGYGKSFPREAWDPKKHMQYILTEFAVEDVARLVQSVIDEHFPTAQQPNQSKIKVVAAGGSAAGMMAAFARVRYPHIVDAAVASSAPFKMIGQAFDINNPLNNDYFYHVTRDFQLTNKKCPEIVQKGYAELKKMFDNKQYDKIQQTFNICQKIDNEAIFEHMLKWIRSSFISFAQGNFPNDDPAAAYPVEIACSVLLKYQDDPVYALSKIIELEYDDPVMFTKHQPKTAKYWRDHYDVISMQIALSGVKPGDNKFSYPSPFDVKTLKNTARCHDIEEEFFDCIDDTGCGTGIDGEVWDWQACTAYVYYQSCAADESCMFPGFTHDLDTHINYCKKVWNTDARLDQLRLGYAFPSLNWTGASNILFTSGTYDPWCGGDIQQHQGTTLLALNIQGESHHADLNLPTKGDRPILQYARDVIFDIIFDMLYYPHDTQRFDKHRKTIDAAFAKGCYANETAVGGSL